MILSACLPLALMTMTAAAPVGIHQGNPPSELAALAGRELAEYAGRIFTEGATLTDDPDAARIFIGTRESSPVIRMMLDNGTMKLPEGPNAGQGYVLKVYGGNLHAAAASDKALLHAVYDLLEHYGVFFQISGERLPEPASFKVLPLDISREPVFPKRGLLPWDNFSCGMSGYDLEDFRQLIDQMARMRFNLLQFHFYPNLIYFMEEVDGETPATGFVGAPVDVFPTKGAIGEEAFGDIEVFGPEPYVANRGDLAAQARASRDLMREVIRYAHSRGVEVCVGFELMHSPVGNAPQTDKPDGGLNTLDPLAPESVELSVKRFRSLVDHYPEADYYWMWQSEGRGELSRQVGREAGAAEMREARAGWAGNSFLAGDIDYAHLFLETVKRLTPEERAKLGTGGWGVEHLFPGIHPDFPEEIIFASLNPYPPGYTVDDRLKFYEVATTGRRAWMIDWWEFDGEQWFPQFRVTWQNRMYDQCAAWGVEAVTLLGWKLSGVEHNVRYLSEYVWNPGLDAETFYRNYLRRLHGTDEEALAEHFLAYDRDANVTPPATPGDDRTMLLGAGWMPMVIPPVPAAPAGLREAGWQNTVKRSAEIAADQRAWLARDREAVALLDQSVANADPAGRPWAEMLRNRFVFRAMYLESMIALNQSYGLFDAAAQDGDIEAGMAAALPRAAEALDIARKAIALYAEVTPSLGDLGVIAQLNEQYYKPVRSFVASLGGEAPLYAELNSAVRMLPEITCVPGTGRAWLPRDGVNIIKPDAEEGVPLVRVSLGGDGSPFHSVFLLQGPVDLEKAPVLDFEARGASVEPVALLFRAGDDATWRALNLIGVQTLFGGADALPRGTLDKDRWTRVTWDLARLVREQFGAQSTVLNDLVLGTWDTPDAPVTLEFRNVTLGRRRTLD